MESIRKHPLVAFREANGQMTQADAAKLVGITQAQWSRLERGLGFARPSVARRISDLTGIALETLLNFNDNETGVTAVE